MPYHSNAELPLAVQQELPVHAQDLYRQTFNQAFTRHADEEAAHHVAWAAVKKSYVRFGDAWKARAGARLRY